MTLIPAPFERRTISGWRELERGLRGSIEAGAISNGWLICGPEGVGKATLAYRIARAILEPESLVEGATLDMPEHARTFRLVAARSHPDLFVAERLVDEKTEKQASEITVETIRRLTEFLSKTAASGGWRAAIVDAADDLNRNAANALLKSLEEPPARTAILLVAHQPGRLLATIRSRCRRIELRGLDDDELADLLAREAGQDGDAARRIGAAARGRPGRALKLAAGEGAAAVELAETFLQSAAAGGTPPGFASNFGARSGAEKWPIFAETVLGRVADAARTEGRRGPAGGDRAAARARRLVEAHAAMSEIFRRGEAVNMDRAQTLHAASRVLGAVGD